MAGEGPATGVEMFMAFAHEGIPAATASGTGRERRLRPGSAMCDIFSLDDESVDWTFVGEAIVFDDYPGFAAAPRAWCQILKDHRGRFRLIGEQVAGGPSEEA